MASQGQATRLCPLADPMFRPCSFHYDRPAKLAAHVTSRHPDYEWTEDALQHYGLRICGTCRHVVSRRGHRRCPTAEAAHGEPNRVVRAPSVAQSTPAASSVIHAAAAPTAAPPAPSLEHEVVAADTSSVPPAAPSVPALHTHVEHEAPSVDVDPAPAPEQMAQPQVAQELPAAIAEVREPVGSRTQRTLPAEASELVAAAAALALERAVAAAAAGSEPTFQAACAALLAIAGRVAVCGGKLSRRLRAKRMAASGSAVLAEMLADEEPGLLGSSELGPLGCSPVEQRVARLTAQGELRRAAAAVSNAPVLDGSAATLRKLQDLHPPGSTVAAGMARGVTGLAISAEQLDVIVARAPPHRAPGPSGWRWEHIRQCYAVPRFQAALLAFVNQLLAGNAPRCPDLQASRLICLDKGNGGVRPIAMPEVWAKLADSASLLVLRPAGEALAPLQLGGGLRGGIEAARWQVHTAATAIPEAVVVACDFKNAFNCIDRPRMLEQVKQRAPGALPYTRWKYGQASPLLWSTASMGTVELASRTGVRQGDPAGPTLFGLALQPALEAAAAQQPDGAIVVAYHDDTYIVGLESACAAAYETLVTEAARAGLQANKTKTQVWGQGEAGMQAARRLAEGLGIACAPGGMRVLGSWLGPQEREQEFARGVVQSTGDWLKALDQLDVPLQVKLLLARRCGWAKPLYLARSCSMDVAAEALGQADEQLARLLTSWLQAPPQQLAAGSPARAQMALPVRLGGLGLTCLTREHCAAARLASARLAQQLLEAAKPRAQPLGQHAVDELKQCAQVLGASQCVLSGKPSSLDDVRAEEPAWGTRPLQRAYTEAAATGSYARIFWGLMGKADTEGVHRLMSARDAASGAWMSALPRAGTQIPCQAIRDELCLRLGISAIPCPVATCKCGKATDSLGHHALSCAASAGAVCLRHTLMIQAWRDAASELGCETGRETPLANLVSADRTRVQAPGVWVAVERAARQLAVVAEEDQERGQEGQQGQQGGQEQHQGGQQSQQEERGQDGQQGQVDEQEAERQREMAAAAAAQCLQQKLRNARGDVLFAFRQRWVVADVTIRNTFALNQRTGLASTGRAAERGEAVKRARYRDYIQSRFTLADFTAAGVDTVGAWGTGAKWLLGKLMDSAGLEKGSLARARAELRVQARVAIARMIGNSKMMDIGNSIAAAGVATRYNILTSGHRRRRAGGAAAPGSGQRRRRTANNTGTGGTSGTSATHIMLASLPGAPAGAPSSGGPVAL